jgi:stage II sporulation protein D
MVAMARRFFVFVAALASAAALLVVPASPALAAPPAAFTFSGSGFGHGVGMSQYGAYGQALEGRNATQILSHYYTGASPAQVNDLVDIRVNLLHKVATAAARSESVGAGGGALQVVVGATTIDAGPADRFGFGVAGGQVSVTRNDAPVGQAAVVTVLWAGTPTVLNLTGPGEDPGGTGHRYRYGLVQLSVVAGAIEAVNVLKMHTEYLRGIAEVPSSWPIEVLKAQVAAARTYALRKYTSGVRADCACHVFDTITDQVFAGWVKESGPGGSSWVAAVDATQASGSTGLAILYNGEPISANYYSSSGGRTENNEDGFGGAPLPYLRSVDDHWSLNSYNPRASWTFTKSQAEVAAAFGLPDVVSFDLSARTVGGAVKSAVGVASDGRTATISGNTLRSRLSLPGAWIRTPVSRLSGDDRFATSVAIGKAAYPQSTTVIIVSGEDAHLVDGLVAGPLAVARAGPLLLATHDGLPVAVGADIEGRKVTTAFLVGGPASLGDGVVDDLSARGVKTITRISGDDRYATAAAVAEALGGERTQAVIASGDPGHLVDALSAGGPAARAGQPVLLVTRDAVPEPTAGALSTLGISSTVVAGGPAVISDAVLANLPAPTRKAGADRYSTAVAIADNYVGLIGAGTVAVASGNDANIVDALAGGALGSVVLLTTPTALAGATRGWLANRSDIGAVRVLGGPAAVSDPTLASIQEAVD